MKLPFTATPEATVLAASQHQQSAATHWLPTTFTIKDIQWEVGSGDIFTWTLEAKNKQTCVFQPGQFNMLYVFGIGEVPISISGNAQETQHFIHTTRMVGGVTKGMRYLKLGQEVGLRGPFGSAWPLDKAKGKDLIIMAGGLGLAPVRPIVYYALQHPEQFASISLLYGTRSPLDIMYRAELEQWQHNSPIHLGITVDRASASWRGNVGVVTDLLKQLPLQLESSNIVAMLCGPEVMMNFSARALQTMGVSAQQIYISLERNMKCAIGHCGHCQMGSNFICKDGPVFSLERVHSLLQVKEL